MQDVPVPSFHSSLKPPNNCKQQACTWTLSFLETNWQHLYCTGNCSALLSFLLYCIWCSLHRRELILESLSPTLKFSPVHPPRPSRSFFPLTFPHLSGWVLHKLLMSWTSQWPGWVRSRNWREESHMNISATCSTFKIVWLCFKFCLLFLEKKICLERKCDATP